MRSWKLPCLANDGGKVRSSPQKIRKRHVIESRLPINTSFWTKFNNMMAGYNNDLTYFNHSITDFDRARDNYNKVTF
jgi:hypothetical protein